RGMFFRPIQLRLTDALQSSVFTGMWHLITVHFALSSLALLVCGIRGRLDLAVWLIAAQFAGYAVIYLVLSLRLGNIRTLFQWTLFAAVAVLAGMGALLSCTQAERREMRVEMIFFFLCTVVFLRISFFQN